MALDILLNVFLFFIVINVCYFTLKILWHYLINIKAVTGISDYVQAISFHTYKPKNSIVPLRGRIIAEYAYQIADKLNVPIILSVGHTVPNEARTESEIYRDYIYSLPNYRKEIKIITTNNPRARDTQSEVTATYQRCLDNHYNYIGVIALLPHLILRIIPYWEKVNSEKKIEICFDGILGPKKYIFWEIAMLIFEFYLPPNSWQRQKTLNLINRKG